MTIKLRMHRVRCPEDDEVGTLVDVVASWDSPDYEGYVESADFELYVPASLQDFDSFKRAAGERLRAVLEALVKQLAEEGIR